jgi:hypothetical protein
MMIKVPFILANKTAVEGIQSKPFVKDGIINTDNITCAFPESGNDNTLVFFNGDDSCVLDMTIDEFEDMLDSYEIKVYDN